LAAPSAALSRLAARRRPEEGALVLDAGDPFAYARFTDRLGQMSEVLLVDSYLRPTRLLELHTSGAITRVLVGRGPNEADRSSISLALSGVPQIQEVRVSDRVLDRFLIPAAGDVWHPGASVDGIGRKISVMARLSGDADAVSVRRMRSCGISGPAKREVEPQEESADEA
jgi:hypothetical protein